LLSADRVQRTRTFISEDSDYLYTRLDELLRLSARYEDEDSMRRSIAQRMRYQYEEQCRVGAVDAGGPIVTTTSSHLVGWY
jgi:hypothetical protein